MTSEKGSAANVTFSILTSAPARRGALALILIGAVVFPGVAGRVGSDSCQRGQCGAREGVRWSASLAGSGPWIAQDGVEGTVPGTGQAYAAIGHGIAVVGVGLTVSAYDAATGSARWVTPLTGALAGASIVSVRTWPGVVTVGVSAGNAGAAGNVGGLGSAGGVGSGSGAGSAGGGGPAQEIVLDTATGLQIRTYRAADSGGAVAAGTRRTVIIGGNSVTSYSNRTGRATWRDPTGRAQQAWRVAGNQLYITVSAQGEVGTAPATAVRQIDLRSGSERLIQSAGGSFDGTLTGALDGVLVFAGADGLSMYKIATGRLTGRRTGAVFEGIDPAQGVLYVDVSGAGRLVGIDPVTGQNEPGAAVPGPPGTYSVLNGVALGLDAGAGGEAWGYSIAKRHVIWTTRSLPWPHYFVDLSGLGGSTDPGSGTVLLATCAKVGQAIPDGSVVGVDGLACLQPRLVAIGPAPVP